MRAPSAGQAHDDAIDGVGREPVRLLQLEERVQRRLNRIADREHLDRRFGDEEPRPEPVAPSPPAAACAENASSTLCSPSSTSGTPVKPACAMSAAVTPLRAPMPAKSNAFSTCSVSRSQLHSPDTCCAAYDSAYARLPFVEARQRGRRRRRAHRGADAFGAAVRRAHRIGSERHQEAAAHVVAGGDGAHELGARAVVALAPWPAPPARRRSRDAPW